MPLVHAVFLTGRWSGRPARADQAEMNRALSALEQPDPWARRTW
jgi:hypothetical protein